MFRLVALLLISSLPLVLTGCVGPMGAGCCPTTGCGGPCGDACDSCTGCGELYVGPWTNHPADCVDPCDDCGNYNGQNGGACRSVFAGYKSLWGYRCGCDPAPVAMSDRCFAPGRANSCGGCDDGCCDECSIEPACGCEGSCDCVGEPVCGSEPSCGFEVGCGMETSCGCEGSCGCGSSVAYPEVIHSEPVLSPPVVESVQPAYKPSRTKQIFRPRTASSGGFLNDHRR